MLVYVFTDNKTLEKSLSKTRLDQDFRLRLFPCSELRRACKNLESPVLVYLDIKDRDTTYKKEITYLLKAENVYPAILDPRGVIEDSSEHWFRGIVDYLPKNLIRNQLNCKRLKSVRAYLENYRKDYLPPVKTDDLASPLAVKHIPVSGWDKIHTGEEYTFYLLYVEIDDKDELEKKYNKTNLCTALEVFRKYLERHTIPYNGRIWMWNGFGGVVLFPYDGKCCPAALSAFKIMLYQFLHHVEESMFPHWLSFRLALHLGDLVYQETSTGNIISDTINSLFHLGKLFTQPGDCTVTAKVLPNLPRQLKDYFIPAGEFEQEKIYKMRRPLFRGNNHSANR